MGWRDAVPFETLKGKTLVKVAGGVGDDVIDFHCTDGSIYRLLHYQDCCEAVYVEDIDGNLDDLIGQEVLLAEEVSNAEDPAPVDDWDESHTWTFYKLSTNRGSVTIRWYGTSNGYYSESVDFEEVRKPDPPKQLPLPGME